MKSEQKVVLVTGSTRGIGLSIAKKFSRNNKNVIYAEFFTEILQFPENVIYAERNICRVDTVGSE